MTVIGIPKPRLLLLSYSGCFRPFHLSSSGPQIGISEHYLPTFFFLHVSISGRHNEIKLTRLSYQ